MFSSMLSLLGSLRGGSSFITNSLRFRSSASAYLNRTFTGTGGTTWTISTWVKRGRLGVFNHIFSCTSGINESVPLSFNANDTIGIYSNGSQAASSTAVFRDPSAWYHIVASSNGTTVICYVNNIQVISYSGTLGAVNTQVNHVIGKHANTATEYLDGYLTEVHFIDGQALTPASFGAIDSSTGVWAPRPYSGTYGTNGFYLKFANTSSVAALGNDSSGNSNTWTVNNVSLTAGATYDSMIDVPVNYSDGGNGRGNYAVINQIDNPGGNGGVQNANLQVATLTGDGHYRSTIAMTSGSWYAECQLTVLGGGSAALIGIVDQSLAITSYPSASIFGYAYSSSALRWNNNVSASYGATWTINDIIGIAFNATSGTLEFFKNGVSQGTAYSTIPAGNWMFCCFDGNNATSGTFVWNFGQRPFTYTPPAGFRALNTNNLPTPSIVNGANFMAATTYTGNAAARSLSNSVNSVSFQPDLVWIKSRTPGATNHALFDSVRGTTKYLSSNTTTAETTLAQSLTAFGADGFSLGTDTTLVNANANSYVAWQWKAGGAAVSNTQGTITSQGSANTTAGLSVVTYTGTGANATVGHGLGVAPKMVIVKSRNPAGAFAWAVWHTALAGSEYLSLNTASGKGTLATLWNSAVPTSSVFNIGTDQTANETGKSNVAYCFAEIAGFSRFSSYTGNGSADGPFVFCGFRPRFVMVKSSSTGNWVMHDTSRTPNNFVGLQELSANSSGTEPAGIERFDFVSNGFKVRSITATDYNTSGVTYIFAAFAENPSKYALAR